jgi:hypothetical protein
MVNAFEGNKAETTTMVPTLQAFMVAHDLPDVTVVADAGMVSTGNQKAIEAAGLSFILGARILDIPNVVKTRREQHPGQDIPDGQVFVQPWPASPTDARRDQAIYYQYKSDRARRTLRGIDEQIAKAERAIAGASPVKRNRFVQLTGGTKTVNRTLEAKARALAGLKGYVTNLQACPDGTPVTAEFVIGAYGRLFQIEKSFRMSKHDLQARPIYARKRDSIEAHLNVVCSPPSPQPLARAPHRLEHQEVHPHRPPLPHRRHPARRPHHHRRRPSPRRPTRRPRPHPHRTHCALA